MRRRGILIAVVAGPLPGGGETRPPPPNTPPAPLPHRPPTPPNPPSALATIAPTPSHSNLPPRATPHDGAATVVECGRFSADTCSRTIGVARTLLAPDIGKPLAIALDDSCPPRSACDRRYPFDALVVFVPPAAASWREQSVHVFG